MVRVTPSRPYVLHTNSAHREDGKQISDYEIQVDINCKNDEVMSATLISANIAGTMLNLKAIADRTLKLSVADTEVIPADATATPPTQESYAATFRELTCILPPGTYDTKTMTSTLEATLNKTCAISHGTPQTSQSAASGTNFRTFIPNDLTNADSTEDVADAGLTGEQADDSGTSYAADDWFTGNHASTFTNRRSSHNALPVFKVKFHETLNQFRIFRTDLGGLTRFGSFKITVESERLQRVLGFSSETTRTSHHYRSPLPTGHEAAKSLTGSDPPNDAFTTSYVNNIEVIQRSTIPLVTTEYGHTVTSDIAANMHHDDAVYIHADIGQDAIASTAGKKDGRTGQKNVLAVVPLTGSAFSQSFYRPPVPISVTTTKSNISVIRFQLRDSAGKPLDFHGIDHQLEILFSVESKTGSERQLANLKSMGRTNSDYNRFTTGNYYPV